jgi:hypothetical protein
VRSEVQIFPGPPTFAADAASVGTPTFEPRRLPAVASAKAGVSAGAIAQLGERLLCKQEVVGSIPSGSTRWLRSKTVAIEDSCDRRRLRSKIFAVNAAAANVKKLVRENPEFARSRLVVRRKTAVDARVLSDIVKRRSIQALPVT